MAFIYLINRKEPVELPDAQAHSLRQDMAHGQLPDIVDLPSFGVVRANQITRIELAQPVSRRISAPAYQNPTPQFLQDWRKKLKASMGWRDALDNSKKPR